MILATPANMRKYRRANTTVETGSGPATIIARQPFAYSPTTDERFSADAGDYWNLPGDEPLTDSEGEPMVLVFEVTQLIDADEYGQ